MYFSKHHRPTWPHTWSTHARSNRKTTVDVAIMRHHHHSSSQGLWLHIRQLTMEASPRMMAEPMSHANMHQPHTPMTEIFYFDNELRSDERVLRKRPPVAYHHHFLDTLHRSFDSTTKHEITHWTWWNTILMHVKCIHDLCIVLFIFQSYLHHIRVISLFILILEIFSSFPIFLELTLHWQKTLFSLFWCFRDPKDVQMTYKFKGIIFGRKKA